MNSVGKPDAANPHVRFDERGRETEPLAKPQRHRALPRLTMPEKCPWIKFGLDRAVRGAHPKQDFVEAPTDDKVTPVEQECGGAGRRHRVGKGQSFGTRAGFQRPSYYWHEFRSAEQESDVERRQRSITEYYRSQGNEEDDPDDDLVRDFTENQLRYELLIGRWGSYSWRRIRNKGVVQSCVEWVQGPETDGFLRLVRDQQGELTTEALVIKHKDRFANDVVTRATQRVLAHDHGFPRELVERARGL